MSTYNHTSIASFAGLTSGQISTAAELTLYLECASTGGIISTALDTLHTEDGRLDRDNWIFYDRGNPGWAAKVTSFTAMCAAQHDTHTILSMKFCYIDPDAVWTAYRDAMLAAETAYPSNRFIWWTLPITTTGDDYWLPIVEEFNSSCRAYCTANDKTLFDIADIESHHVDDTPSTYLGYESLCAEYTSDGGHPDSGTAPERLAKAFWVMMSEMNGPSLLGFHKHSYVHTTDGTSYPVRKIRFS